MIQDNGGNDTLIIKGYNKDEANFTKQGKDLIISFTNSTDKITIKNHFKWLFGKPNRVENIIFDKDENIAIANIDKFISDKLNNFIENQLNQLHDFTVYKDPANLENSSSLVNSINSTNPSNSSKTSEFITSFEINKIIEQINTYSENNGYTNFTFDDMKNGVNLQVYVS